MTAAPRLIMGVDPGLSGAIALYDPASDAVVGVWDMPVHEIRGKRHLDLHQLAMLVDTHAKETAAAFVEEVGAMPGQGVSSMFRFGFSAGVISGIVAGCVVPLHYVRPAIWKKAMGLTRDKDDSRRRASHLFPRSASLFSRVKDDGRAESLLLAVYGAQRLARKLG